MSDSSERRLRILALLAGGSPDAETVRLCQVCAEVGGVSGAGIMLMSPESLKGSVCTTDGICDLIEQLQFTLGEGPSVDAYQEQRPVLEPDLAFPMTPRWLAFSGPIINAGVKAVFGFPIRVGAIRLGALNLYRNRPGSLTNDEHADSLVMADIAARAILVMQSNAPPGELALELQRDGTFHYVVHQATGMVAAQLDVSVGVALVRLRAYAFANDQLLVDVAREVVDRKLRFEP
ncbi:MAG TPA: GAF and ANTAR domain-containing protein [Acidimicrobiia bacterium]|nr:GAF and ANTAR domain-containing protein [Acidimicrobiia bacterium]